MCRSPQAGLALLGLPEDPLSYGPVTPVSSDLQTEYWGEMQASNAEHPGPRLPELCFPVEGQLVTLSRHMGTDHSQQGRITDRSGVLRVEKT